MAFKSIINIFYSYLISTTEQFLNWWKCSQYLIMDWCIARLHQLFVPHFQTYPWHMYSTSLHDIWCVHLHSYPNEMSHTTLNAIYSLCRKKHTFHSEFFRGPPGEGGPKVHMVEICENCVTPTFHLAPLSFEYSARQKCILSFGGDCRLCPYKAS